LPSQTEYLAERFGQSEASVKLQPYVVDMLYMW